MKYEIFKKELISELEKRFLMEDTNCKCKVKKLPKVNKNEEGLFVEVNGEGRVVLNLNDLFEEYGQERLRMARIAEEVSKRIMSHLSNEEDDEIAKRVMDIMQDKEKVKSRVIYYAVNVNLNENLLKLVPHRMMLDLMVIYRLVIDSDDNGMQSIVITNEQMKEMGMTEKELYDMAVINTPAILSMRICKMYESIPQTGGLELLSLEEQADRAIGNLGETKGNSPAKITCIPRVNASYNLIDTTCIRIIAEKMNSDIYVLPSSLVELMCFKVGGNISLERLCAIMREANSKPWQLSDDDYLSDSIYIYKRKEDKLSIIANK